MNKTPIISSMLKPDNAVGTFSLVVRKARGDYTHWLQYGYARTARVPIWHLQPEILPPKGLVI